MVRVVIVAFVLPRVSAWCVVDSCCSVGGVCVAFIVIVVIVVVEGGWCCWSCRSRCCSGSWSRSCNSR